MTDKRRHPSGKPLPKVKRGIPAQTRWPRDDFVVPSLNRRTDQLTGGCGFVWSGAEQNQMWLETWAKKR